MKNLPDLFSLKTRKPITPTVAEKFQEHTVIIEFNDNEAARFDIEDGGYVICGHHKSSLIELIESERLLDNMNNKEKQKYAQTYLKNNYTKNRELTILFKENNKEVKQVWAAQY